MNLNRYLLIFLVVLIALSKEILVFNEEVLVLFSFFIFISLIYNFFSDSIASELNSRSVKIHEEFQYYKDIQKNILTYLMSYHNKQIFLLDEIKNIFINTKKMLVYVKIFYSKMFLKFLFSIVEEKLKKISSNDSKFDILLQNRINSRLIAFLISKYNYKGNKEQASIFLANSLFFLLK